MAKVIVKAKAKKKWFPIVSPKMFSERVIGESHLYDSESAVGRFVQVNLMNLTNDMKNQNINVKFQIVKSQEGRLMTRITGYNIIPASVKRVVRRRQNRIDDSFTVKTADGITLRIKPMVLTRGKASNPVVKEIRKKIKEELIKMISTSNYDNVFSNIVFKKTQKAMRDKISKIHPVKSADIREIKKEDKIIIGESVAEEGPTTQEPAEEKAEAKPKKTKKAKKVEEEIAEEQQEEAEEMEESPEEQDAVEEQAEEVTEKKPAKKKSAKSKKEE